MKAVTLFALYHSSTILGLSSQHHHPGQNSMPQLRMINHFDTVHAAAADDCMPEMLDLHLGSSSKLHAVLNI